jgi:multiple sugar transport system ATP-binding protein
MAQVGFDRVSKIYPDGTRAVNDINLDIQDGEFMVLVGPSGCGKTTALRMVAGLEEISEGVLKIGDRVVNHVPSRDRDIAMVFQSYALYPHLSVYENIAFGLRLKKMSKAEIDERVKRASSLLGLDEYLKRKPRALSGGQRQRVAMGRAIVREPAAFLMDEPLSNLDAKLRVQMRAEIAKLQSDLGVTTIYVTHDQIEAMTMGDRVAVMRKGELQQVDDPQTLYDRPVNLFVGGFIGSPAMNMLDSEIVASNGGIGAKVGEQTISLGAETLEQRPGLKAFEGKHVILGIRPEDLEDAALETDFPEGRTLKGKLELREALGSEIMAHFSFKGAHAETDETRELARDSGAEGTEKQIGAKEDEAVVVGRFGARSRIKVGEELTAVVDTRALHFFDPETGLGIYDGTTPSTKGAPS